MRRTRLTVGCQDMDQALDTVGALARMQLNARRAGCTIQLRDVSTGLVELLNFAGLGEVLAREGQRQAEQRE